ncbi:hypothetical protein M422DRAFT_55398 [Sphaerobolus stellatus SS14]|uniref:Crossover junction endonuclease MUS81 n=1 Tax=Sphaerobolus stellatus (strain SS14) TaxID=990650 RepID=A0A0C9UMC8_SPHS4|nr:hypothetical protein M422DRAFT_55398 [Sphaerobolus stellatus SS14]
MSPSSSQSSPGLRADSMFGAPQGLLNPGPDRSFGSGVIGSVASPSYNRYSAADRDASNRHQEIAVPSASSPGKFGFYYLDSDSNTVSDSSEAAVDIIKNRLWLKIRYTTRGLHNEHSVYPFLYPQPSLTAEEKVLEGWLLDDAAEDLALRKATGFSRSPAIGASQISASTSRSNIASRDTLGKGVSRGPAVVHNPYELAAMLRAEGKSKSKTLDPARALPATTKEWEVQNAQKSSMASTSKPQPGASVVKANLAQTSNMARSSSFSINQVSSSSTQASSSQLGNVPQPPLRRATTLPESMLAPRPEPSAMQNNQYVSVSFSQPNLITNTTAKRKGKGKGRIQRGRVSDFAPALPAVDEFDRGLDRQAASQEGSSRGGNSAQISADMMDDVADLTSRSETFVNFTPIVFEPNTYDIVLLLDNREVKTRDDPNYMIEALQKKGVTVEKHPLVLGDVLWIARRKPCYHKGNETDQCVVDYILERKRLDDLEGSIRDGRFHEQKIRLAYTALKVFYLVEHYDMPDITETGQKAIMTAKSSTQIVDGFHLKETPRISYTINFLATMHKTICEMYEDKPLYIIPSEHVSHHRYMGLQKHLRDTQPDRRYMMTYESFDQICHKTKNLTARDLFAQMLLCVKGVSVEKAAGVIKNYPTVRSLWEAFRVAEEKEKKEKRRIEALLESGVKLLKKDQKYPEAKDLLSNLGDHRLKLGPALSSKIYTLFRANSYAL